MSPRLSEVESLIRRFFFILLCSFPGLVYAQQRADTTANSSVPDSLQPHERRGLVSVKSDPAGAEVYDDTSFLGITPIDTTSLTAGRHLLRFFHPSTRIWNARAAVDSIVVVPNRENTCIVVLPNVPDRAVSGSGVKSGGVGQDADLSPAAVNVNGPRMEYVAGGVMILSGALSAYLKTTSDNKFDTYLTSRDPALLNQVRRLDKWAGVSLFITEISFAVLVYFLISN